jgi:hypothetical protein
MPTHRIGGREALTLIGPASAVLAANADVEIWHADVAGNDSEYSSK